MAATWRSSFEAGLSRALSEAVRDLGGCVWTPAVLGRMCHDRGSGVIPRWVGVQQILRNFWAPDTGS